MTYTALTRTISGITAGEITSGQVDCAIVFVIGTDTYFGVIATVGSTTVVLDASTSLPDEDGTVTSITVANVALAANAILDLSEVKDYLKISSTSYDEDNFLTLAINDASTEIENYINNKVVVQTLTDEVYDGDGTNRIYTNYSPIVGLGAVGADTAAQLAALRVRDDVDDAFAAVETDIDHIHLDIRKPYIELFDEIFPYGRQTVKITYRAGWSTVPTEFRDGCMMLVVSKFKESAHKGDRFGKESESNSGTVGNISTRYIDVRKKVYELIAPYRKFV